MIAGISFFLVSLLIFTNGLFADNVTQDLSDTNFLLGIAQLGAVTLQQSPYKQCGRELDVLLAANAKQMPWSTKVFDSFGHAPRSFIWGNYFWFSARELCDDLNTAFSMTLKSTVSSVLVNATSPFPMRFTMLYMRFSTLYYVDWKLPYENYIHLGLCLPQSCDQKILAHLADAYFHKEVFSTQRNFNLKLQVVQTKVPQLKWSFFKQTGSIIYM